MEQLIDLAKAHLRIDGNDQDGLIQHLAASAVAEFYRYTAQPEDNAMLLKPDVCNGIILAVQADFDGDPARREVYLSAARSLWTPYCLHYGV